MNSEPDPDTTTSDGGLNARMYDSLFPGGWDLSELCGPRRIPAPATETAQPQSDPAMDAPPASFGDFMSPPVYPPGWDHAQAAPGV